MSKTIKYFSIPFKEPNSLNFIKKRFLNPCFNNEIVEENYIDYFNTRNKLKKVDNSIMSKKNIELKIMKKKFLLVLDYYFSGREWEIL